MGENPRLPGSGSPILHRTPPGARHRGGADVGGPAPARREEQQQHQQRHGGGHHRARAVSDQHSEPRTGRRTNGGHVFEGECPDSARRQPGHRDPPGRRRGLRLHRCSGRRQQLGRFRGLRGARHDARPGSAPPDRAHLREHLVDPAQRDAVATGQGGQMRHRAAPAVDLMGVQEGSDVAQPARMGAERYPARGGGTGGGSVQTEDHAQRAGPSRSVGARAARDPPGPHAEGQSVDGGRAAVALGEFIDFDHGTEPAGRGPAGHRTGGCTSVPSTGPGVYIPGAMRSRAGAA